MQYFVGKICTIFTHAINRNFKEENPATFVEQPYNYFVGVVEDVDEQGILITNITSGFKSYFFFPGVISIAEEEFLDPDDKKDAEIIELIKEAKPVEKQEFVDVDSMTELLKNIKEKHK